MIRYKEEDSVRELATIAEERQELKKNFTEEKSEIEKLDSLNYRERMARLEHAVGELQRECGLNKKQIRHG